MLRTCHEATPTGTRGWSTPRNPATESGKIAGTIRWEVSSPSVGAAVTVLARCSTSRSSGTWFAFSPSSSWNSLVAPVVALVSIAAPTISPTLARERSSTSSRSSAVPSLVVSSLPSSATIAARSSTSTCCARLRLDRARARLQDARDQTPAHPPLPSAHERQSRALHPHPARRLGLRMDQPQGGRSSGCLTATPTDLASLVSTMPVPGSSFSSLLRCTE